MLVKGKQFSRMSARERFHHALQAGALFLFLVGAVPYDRYPDVKVIKAKMEEHRIIPDLHKLATFNIVEVTFKNDTYAYMGNVVSREVAKEPPHITYNYDDDAYYTLMMSDLDAPNPRIPNLREWHHWLVVNIPRDNLTAGETLSEYIGPGTQNFTGRHRYVITAYRQPGDRLLRFDEDHLDNKSDWGRLMWSINRFATDYDYGDPFGMNFWYTDHERYY